MFPLAFVCTEIQVKYKCYTGFQYLVHGNEAATQTEFV